MGFSILDKRYLGMDECADYLGLTKGTLYVWVCRKKIPYLKMGKLVKFDLRKIEAWVRGKQIHEIN